MTIEQLIVKHLNDALSVPAYGDVPHDHPVSYCTVERTGGGIDNRLRTAMITIDIYGSSMVAVQNLNEEVLAAMDRLVEHNMVASCRLNSNYNDTNTETKEYRYGALFDIVHY